MKLLFSSFLILLSFQLLAQPANNNCSGAIELFQTREYSSIVQDGLGSTTFGACYSGEWDVWYKFTATLPSAELAVEPDKQDVNFSIQIVSDSCSGANVICQDNWGTNMVEIVQLQNLIVGKTYYVRVLQRQYSNLSRKFRISLIDLAIEPPCSPFSLNASNSSQNCQDISTLCDMKGNCGNTHTYVNSTGQSQSYTADVWQELQSKFCGSIENNSFLKFTAQDTFALFRIYGSCSNPNTSNMGLQFMVYDYQTQNATCDVGEITVYYCGYILNTNMMGSGGSYVNPRGLTPGETYFIMIDGFAGSLCDYKIDPIHGIRPMASIENNEEYACTNDQIVLSASGGFGNYNWTSAIPISNNYTDSIVTTIDSAGVYAFYLTDDKLGPNCPDTDTGYVIVNEPADPYAGLDLTLCLNDSILLTPIPSDSNSIRSWSLIDTVGGAIGFPGGQSGDSIYIYASDTGSYQLAFVELNLGCNAVFDTLKIQINALPELFTSNDTTICEGDSVQLSIAGADTYIWLNNGATSPTIWVQPTDSTSYAVSGHINNCISLDSVFVSVNQNPILSVWSDTVCLGDSSRLSVQGASSYLWNNGLANDSTHYLLLDSTTTFNVIGTTNGCNDSAYVTVVVHSLPIISFPSFDPDTICLSSGIISLPNASPSGGYYLGTGVVSGQFNPDSSGIGSHTITYHFTDANGCSADSSQIITVEECLGIAETKGGDVLVFPIPFNTSLKVVIDQGKQFIKVYNPQGKLILEKTFSKGTHIINTEEWSQGVYYMELNGKLMRVLKQ